MDYFFERLLTETYNPTLKNLCTRTAQSSRGGHSRRVEKWRVYVHLAVEKGSTFLLLLLMRVFLLIIVSNIPSFVSA